LVLYLFLLIFYNNIFVQNYISPRLSFILFTTQKDKI